MRLIVNFNFPRDPRRHILFLDDIFDGRYSATLNHVKELLNTEYLCKSMFKRRDPSDMARSIKRDCERELNKADLIVAYGSGATLAAQV